MKKELFVIFSDDKGKFVHILLNVFDFKEKGYDIGVIFESAACKLINDYENKNYDKWERLKSEKLIFAVCKVCAKATNSLESAQRQNLPIQDDLSGHPALEKWTREGYDLNFI